MNYLNEAKVEPSNTSNEKNWKKLDKIIKELSENNKIIAKGLGEINKTIKDGFKDLVAEIHKK